MGYLKWALERLYTKSLHFNYKDNKLQYKSNMLGHIWIDHHIKDTR